MLEYILANIKAVNPLIFFKLTSAPFSNNNLTVSILLSVLEYRLANIKAVNPTSSFFKLTSAPFSNNNLTVSILLVVLEYRLAKIKSEDLLLLEKLTSAPSSNNNLISLVFPFFAASIKFIYFKKYFFISQKL